MFKSSKKSSKDKSKASSSDDVTFDPLQKYDPAREQWYYEGRRNKDGKKVKSYCSPDDESLAAASAAAAGDERTPRGVDELAGRMEAASLEQQSYHEPDPQEYSYGSVAAGAPQDLSGYGDTSPYQQTSAPDTTSPQYQYAVLDETSAQYGQAHQGYPDAAAAASPAGYPSPASYPDAHDPRAYPAGASDTASVTYTDEKDRPRHHHKEKDRDKGKAGKGKAGKDKDSHRKEKHKDRGDDGTKDRRKQKHAGEGGSQTAEQHYEEDGAQYSQAYTGASNIHQQTVAAYGPASGSEYPYGAQADPVQTTVSAETGSVADDGHVKLGEIPEASVEDEVDAEDDYDEDDDEEFRAAIEAGRNAYQNPQLSSTGGHASTYAEYQGTQTPAASLQQTMSYMKPGDHISATPEEQEKLDPRYKIEPSSRFEPGEVFKVLWYEPKGGRLPGSLPGGGSVISEETRLKDHYRDVFRGFRRYIVVANDEGHCTCVPILTYDRKGCLKKGVKPRKHGIVHEQSVKAKRLAKEPELGFAPIRIYLSAKNETILPESRVNYSKLVTVEHNVKVFFIGSILMDDFDIVQYAVNKCWEDKVHDKAPGRRKR